MRISASVLHRYEIFDICKELNSLGYLSNLYSTYPKFVIKKYDIPLSKVENFMFYEIVSRVNDLLWDKNFYFSKYDYLITDLFDQKISRIINNDIDVFYGSGGMCLNTFKSLNKNILKIFHSTSMHISSKKKLLEDIGYDKDKIVYPLMEKKYISEAEYSDFIICTSDHTYNSYIENGFNENKLILNHSGIDIERFKYDKQYELNDGKFRFLFVGNLSLRKGGIKLLESYKRIRTKKTELIIVGTIDLSIKGEIKNYFNERDIFFLGKFKNEELYKIYSKCHLLCLFASEEGFAKVLGEAMACGVPILCSENSGGSHFIKSDDQGRVLQNLKINNIAEELSSFVGNLEKIIKNKRHLSTYAKKSFSWKKSVSNLAKKLKLII